MGGTNGKCVVPRQTGFRKILIGPHTCTTSTTSTDTCTTTSTTSTQPPPNTVGEAKGPTISVGPKLKKQKERGRESDEGENQPKDTIVYKNINIHLLLVNVVLN